MRAGATVMFSETTEVRDAIDQLTARAATPEVAEGHGARDGLVRRLPAARPRRPQRQHHAGQQEGRPANIVEKAMGSIVKSGSAPIAGVLAPRTRRRAISVA